MLKQHRSYTSARKAATPVSAACLSAFLVFGNAVSAFGNAAANANSRPKAPTAKSSAPNTDKRKDVSTQPASDDAKSEATPELKTKTNASKPAFRKIGEPFVVTTADVQQSSTQTPTQTDATRPPGTEQQQTVPPTARPNPPANPQTPPSTQQPAPQNPPGTQSPTATTPPATTAPSPQPTAVNPNEPPQTETTTPEQNLPEPNFPSVQPRPVPPLPSLERVGVISGDMLSLTLNEAIRRALENN